MTTQETEGAVRLHLRHMHVRGLTPQSIYNRSRALARLSKHVGGPILYLDEPTLRAWQDARSDQLDPASRRGELSNVREFYRWAVVEGLRDTDPTTRLPMPRAPRRHPRPMADAALARVMALADPATAAILGLGAFCGLRACEIARLDWSEVDLDAVAPSVHVTKGKGGHSRTVPMSPVIVGLLRALPERHGPVIRRLDGKASHVAAHGISSRANRFLHEHGVTDTLHQTRHRFVTAAYQSCQDLRACQELAGHANPSTTALYAAAASNVAHDAVMAAGELAVPA